MDAQKPGPLPVESAPIFVRAPAVENRSILVDVQAKCRTPSRRLSTYRHIGSWIHDGRQSTLAYLTYLSFTEHFLCFYEDTCCYMYHLHV